MDTVASGVAAYPWLTFLAIPAIAAALAGWLNQRYAARLSLPDARPYWAVAVAAAGVFLLIAIAINLNGVLVGFDHRLASAFAQSMPSSLLWALSWFTYLGNRNLLAIIAILLTVWLWWWRRERAMALLCAVATGGGGLLNMAFKHTFQRVRPEHIHGYVHESGWSFPSGHASASMAVYGFACYIVLRLTPARWHRACLIGTAMLIAAIGASRVLLQVHYLSDVLAGFAASLAWLALCLGAMRRWHRPRTDDLGHGLG